VNSLGAAAGLASAGLGQTGLGLASAASWGGSDFVGGVGARRSPAILVVASGQILSLIVLIALCLGLRIAVPGRHDLLCAAFGGFEGALALAIFYRALAMGAMGLTAALTGLLTALVPVLFSLFRYGLPTALTLVGLAMGLAAIWLITNAPVATVSGVPVQPAALFLGATAGIGFGLQLVLFKLASGGGILWAMTSARVAGVAALLLTLLFIPPKGTWRGFWITGISAGLLDTIGNLFYIEAARIGRLDVAALICSLYPAGTILLAALVLRERPTRRQMAGIAMALAAVLLLGL
jgi:drug/metabolite transporter (DMT)-like permease